MSIKGIWSAIKAFRFFQQAVKEAKQEVTTMDGVKPGWKTSEFWVTVLASALTLLESVQGNIPQPWGLIAISLMTAAYNIARGLSKS